VAEGSCAAIASAASTICSRAANASSFAASRSAWSSARRSIARSSASASRWRNPSRSPTACGSASCSRSDFSVWSISFGEIIGMRASKSFTWATRSRNRRTYKASASSAWTSGNWPTNRSPDDSRTQTVPSSSTRPQRAASAASCGSMGTCLGGATLRTGGRGPAVGFGVRGFSAAAPGVGGAGSAGADSTGASTMSAVGAGASTGSSGAAAASTGSSGAAGASTGSSGAAGASTGSSGDADASSASTAAGASTSAGSPCSGAVTTSGAWSSCSFGLVGEVGVSLTSAPSVTGGVAPPEEASRSWRGWRHHRGRVYCTVLGPPPRERAGDGRPFPGQGTPQPAR